MGEGDEVCFVQRLVKPPVAVALYPSPRNRSHICGHCRAASEDKAARNEDEEDSTRRKLFSVLVLRFELLNVFGLVAWIVCSRGIISQTEVHED